jgi:hypothetical protein
MRLLINGVDTECDVSISGYRAPDAKRSNPRRDFQRSKCYAWERRFYNSLPRSARMQCATGAECKRIADEFFARSGLGEAPHIVTRSKHGGSFYYPHKHEIRLAAPWYIRTLAHELAHSVLRRRGLSSHGAEFCAVLAAIYAWQFKVSESTLRADMRAFGLKVL